MAPGKITGDKTTNTAAKATKSGHANNRAAEACPGLTRAKLYASIQLRLANMPGMTSTPGCAPHARDGKPRLQGLRTRAAPGRVDEDDDVASTMKTVDGVPETPRDFVDIVRRVHSSRRPSTMASEDHCNTGAHRTTGDKRTVVGGWIRRRRAATEKCFRGSDLPAEKFAATFRPLVTVCSYERNAKYTKCGLRHVCKAQHRTHNLPFSSCLPVRLDYLVVRS
jgi:hypothetical protein